MGELVGTGGHVVALRRTASGGFDVSESHSLDQLVDAGLDAATWLMPMGEAAARSMPTIGVDAAQAASIRHGRSIPWDDSAQASVPGPVGLIHDGDLLAIGQVTAGMLRYSAVFA